MEQTHPPRRVLENSRPNLCREQDGYFLCVNERIATINSAVFIRLRTDGLAACRLSYGIKKPFNPAPSSLKWLFILNLNYILTGCF